MPLRVSRALLGVAAPLALALALGCETAQRAGESAAFTLNPVASTEVAVASVEVRGPYLFVDVRGRQLSHRFVTPASPDCAQVLAPEATVRYAKRGNFGRFSRDDVTCDATGTLSPARWRDRQPRRRSPGQSVVPRSTARFEVFHRDDTYILLRGRFALASRIGIPSAFDLVAVLRDSEVCREVASRREASLEFRQAGRVPFQLLGARAACPVEGFAKPPVGTEAAPPAGG